MKIEIPSFYPKDHASRETIMFMLAFKRKYKIEIYHSIHSHLDHAIKKNKLMTADEMINLYIHRWQFDRPEVLIYRTELCQIYTYIYNRKRSKEV